MSGERHRPWTAAEVAILKRLWPTHFDSEIAELLDRSRNSVIGKGFRLFGTKPGRPSRRPKPDEPEPPPPPEPVQPPEPEPPPAPTPRPEAPPFPGQCRVPGCRGTAARPYRECHKCRAAGRRAA